MKSKTIRTVILFATISLIGIVVTQIFWAKTAYKMEARQIELQQQQDSLNRFEFNDRVTIALSNVVERILTINKDSAEIYDVVHQQSTNFFTAKINDTLHPYLLQELLKEEFDQQNINEDFAYGIYDCFTESIVYGNFVPIVSSAPEMQSTPPPLKWNRDGHFFSVFFPNRKNLSLEIPEAPTEIWIFAAILIVLIVSFFIYSILVLVQQKKLSEIKTDFINNMTHELKTPISTISLSSEILLKQNIHEDPDRIQRYAQIIFNENNRLKSQVEKVLQFAKLDRGEINFTKDKIDLHEIIQDCIQNFGVHVQDHHTQIKTNLSASNSILWADRVHLSNVFHNLLDNALKYSTSPAIITIRTGVSNHKIFLEVIDEGNGITEEQQKHIFDKFYRVHTGDRHDVKGFGLGLHYVKIITEAHQGIISVKSKLGKGSTFRIDFPII